MGSNVLTRNGIELCQYWQYLLNTFHVLIYYVCWNCSSIKQQKKTQPQKLEDKAEKTERLNAAPVYLDIFLNFILLNHFPALCIYWLNS